MKVEKSNYFISSLNEILLASFKNRLSLSPILIRKRYRISQIYGVFSSNHSFLFAREGVVPFEEWEEIKDDSSLPCYEWIHKKKFQLLNASDSNFLAESFERAPWHQEEIFRIGEQYAIPIEASKLIPQNLIMSDTITSDNLEKVKLAIVKILEETPEIIDCYFENIVTPPKVV